jgi:HD-GYP domain-containing protein (c-di-GMP phosphodiesterase class II)
VLAGNRAAPMVGAELEARLADLLREKDGMGRELLRCHEQLSLIYELTEHIATLQDPDVIEQTLLRHYAGLITAGALFLDANGCCQRIDPGWTGAVPVELRSDDVRAALAANIELARRARRAMVPVLTDAESAVLGASHVLLSTLQRSDAEPSVVIALRMADQTPFDTHDVLASDSVLAYGAQVMSNMLMVRHLHRTALETVCTLVNAIDAKDNYTSDHSQRVGGLGRMIGEALGLSRPRLQALEWAGLLHDVGKIGISEAILRKEGPLTPAESREMQRHAQIGYDVLKPVGQFNAVLRAVLHHHENHDGSGYPEGLKRDAIPLEAQIIHIVDIFDALTTDRPYRRRFDVASAFEILEQGAGSVTEPELTRLFIRTFQQFMRADPGGFRARFVHLLPDGRAADATM